MGWEAYTKVKRIGSGSFGAAWLIKRKKDGIPLVCKEVNVRNVPKKEREKIFEEVEVLRKLRHENIIGLHEAFTDNASLNIIMEYGDGGDLDKMIRSAKGTRIKEATIVDIFTQICQGVQYVHSLRILHRDLKGANILITKKGVIKLCDFGVARVMSPDTNMALTQIGTPYYLSPEICEGKPYDAKSDVWSLGCVLYELCTLRRPFEGDGLPALVVKICRGRYAPVSTQYTRDLRHLVDMMIRVNPAERATVDDVLSQHIIQQQIKEDKIKKGEAAQEREQADTPAGARGLAAPPPMVPMGSDGRIVPGAGGAVGVRRGSQTDASAPPENGRNRSSLSPEAGPSRPTSQQGRSGQSTSAARPPPPMFRRQGSLKANGAARPTIAQLQSQASPASRASPLSNRAPSPRSQASPMAKDSPKGSQYGGASPVTPANRQTGQTGRPASRSRSPEVAYPRSRRGSKDSTEGDFQDVDDVAGLPKNVKSAYGEQESAERELARLLGKAVQI